MRAFLERWGLVITAIAAALMLVLLFVLTGCAAYEGAAAAARGESSDVPTNTTGVNALLWVLGYAAIRDGVPFGLKALGKKAPLP